MSLLLALVSVARCGYNQRVSRARPDPNSPSRAAAAAAGRASGVPASSREVAGGHEPPAAYEAADAGPSVVVKEPGTERYAGLYSDATVVTRRRAQSLPDGHLPVQRKRWTGYVVWGVVGLAAFLLGGALSQLRKSGGTGTVVGAASVRGNLPAGAQPPAPAAAEPHLAEPHLAEAQPGNAAQPGESPAPEQAEVPVIDPTALEQLPPEAKLKSPRPKAPGGHGAPASTSKPSAPTQAPASPKPAVAPAKDIPAEI